MRLFTLMLSLVVLSGCLLFDPRDKCLFRDGRPWTRLSSPPANAAAMRHQLREMPDYSLEYWFALPDGREARWEMVDAPATATILPLTDDERVVCVRQFRPGPARRMLSLPGGLIDPGESVVDAARRELREETGYAATSLQEVAATQANSRTRPSHTLVALGCRPEHAQDLDDFEDIDVELVTLRDFRSLLRSGSLSTTEHAYLGLDFLGLL